MMSEQNRAGSGKAISNVLVALLLIAISIVLILFVWFFLRGIISKSPDTSCLGMLSSFSLGKSCYNGKEVEVNMKRGYDELEIEKLKFDFGESAWEIKGDKCLDIRVKGKRYGTYCPIIKKGETIFYVFNMSGIAKQDKVRVGVQIKDNLCVLGETSIENSC